MITIYICIILVIYPSQGINKGMGRFSAKHKEESRKRILNIAGKLFREKGYVATGVERLMKAAGLTQGGFYGHFPSKDGLLMEAISATFTKTRKYFLHGLEDKEGLPFLQEMVRRFISRQHRDCMGESCPTTSLATEVARASDDVKEVFETEVVKTLDEIEKKMPVGHGLSAKDHALATVALGIGAVSLARTVKDQALSDRILKVARKFALSE